MTIDLEQLAADAAGGDSEALAALIKEIQHPVYRLALRFLSHPADAEDAAQEILIRVMTQLSTFEGRSQFMTWVYTVATHMLLRTKKRAVESSVAGPERFARIIDEGLADRDYTAEEAEYNLLCKEIRISCTYGMLLCLSRPLRAAYILGDVLGLPDSDGAGICEISRPAYRQRLSRARRIVRQVIDGRCGLVDSTNSCRCGRQIEASIATGLVDPARLALANHPVVADSEVFERATEELDELVAIGNLYRADRFAAPSEVWVNVKRAFPALAGGT